MAGAEDDDRRIAIQSAGEVSCSICLELVVDDGTRSKAKLQCGHHFHLDCIGSAFNMKGAMQCPNCRNLEKGHWLFANGSTRPFPEFVMEDWIPDEDFYALTYPEMCLQQYLLHWCPFAQLSQTASFEELEPATTIYPNEFHAHHAPAVNYSYLEYVGPNPAATQITSDSNNTDDHPWNSRSNDHVPQLAFAPQYHHHHHSPSFSLPGPHVVDGETDSSAARGLLSYPHPVLFRSNPRTAPAINFHQGSSTQMREHLHTQHHVFNHQRQHHANGPTLASPLVSVTRRGIPPAPRLPMPDQNVGFFIYPPPGSSGGHHEPESDHFRAWERDWFPHFPALSNHRTNSIFWERHL